MSARKNCSCKNVLKEEKVILFIEKKFEKLKLFIVFVLGV